jgi:cytochrome c
MFLNDVYEILLILSVLVHLYFSSLLLGGFPMMVMTTRLGARDGQAHLRDLGLKMSRVGPRVMVLAISLGLLLGLVLYGKYGRHVIHNLDAFWIGYGLLLILIVLAFWGIYVFKTRMSWITQNSSTHVMMSGGIIVCLLGMTFLFVSSHIMTLHPDYSESVVQEGLLASLSLPTVWPRFFHIVLGSVAATGMVITLYGTLRPCHGKEQEIPKGSSIPPFDVQITRYGVGWTLAGTLPQIVVGPWLLLSLPDEVRMRLVDGASLSSLVFFVSLTLALLALVLLNASLMVPHVRGLVWTGLGSLFLTIVLMVMVREEVRKAWMPSFAAADTFQELSLAVVSGVTMTIAIVLGFLIMRLSTSRQIGN